MQNMSKRNLENETKNKYIKQTCVKMSKNDYIEQKYATNLHRINVCIKQTYLWK